MSFRLGISLPLAFAVAALALPSTQAVAQPIDPAVVGERLQRLSANVEAVELAQSSQKRQLENLGNDVHRLREEISQTSKDMASQNARRPWAEDTKRLSDDIKRHSEDLKRLADAVSEVDRKRAADHEQVLKILADLRRAINAAADAPAPPRSSTRSGTEPKASGSGAASAKVKDKDKDKEAEKPKEADKPKEREPAPEEAAPDKYVEHTVANGQTLSLIVAGFNASAKKQGYKTLTPEQVAKFNKIKDASKVREGMKLKLPLVPAPTK